MPTPDDDPRSRLEQRVEYFGVFDHDCSADLPEPERSRSVTQLRQEVEWLGAFDEHGKRIDPPTVGLTLSPPAGADAAVVARDLAELTAAVEAYRAGDKAALVEAWKRCLDDGFTVTAR